MAAHLWPPLFKGRRSCCVNRFMNQPCRVTTRLSSQRGEAAGNRVQGRRRASPIRGTPISMGDSNWVKKLIAMVRLRVLSHVYERLDVKVRLGRCVM